MTYHLREVEVLLSNLICNEGGVEHGRIPDKPKTEESGRKERKREFLTSNTGRCALSSRVPMGNGNSFQLMVSMQVPRGLRHREVLKPVQKACSVHRSHSNNLISSQTMQSCDYPGYGNLHNQPHRTSLR